MIMKTLQIEQYPVFVVINSHDLNQTLYGSKGVFQITPILTYLDTPTTKA